MNIIEGLLAVIVALLALLAMKDTPKLCYPGPVETLSIKLNQECKIFAKYKCLPGYENNGNYTPSFTRDVPGNYRNDIEKMCQHQQFCCTKSTSILKYVYNQFD